MADLTNIVPCPYKSLPDSAYWHRVFGEVPPQDIDPVTEPGFQLTKTTRIATAGSCFAQHIARHLRNSGGTYLVTEPGHSLLNDQTKKDFNYGTFTARFGNIYTTRQLRQLLSRAYGSIRASDDIWEEDDGSFVDPFPPSFSLAASRAAPNSMLTDTSIMQLFARWCRLQMYSSSQWA